ncbi:hypothetical protein TEQG_08636 [Trichophyton equinum CBS 127.97]|uniref:Uncharacterized protein n=1 Tax=Trichophyton equinum (strain ATCC MYA-4606 / CBS 127.97) TaxID=559882 RepID=F2PNI9_TRIEC|nr:hypothetical protein TEQG_08636 [Trichophyton equinum CBS 127.97]
MPGFSATFLLEKKNIWQRVILKFYPALEGKIEARKDENWHYLVVHGIQLAPFRGEQGLKLLEKEITTFNKELSNSIAKTLKNQEVNQEKAREARATNFSTSKPTTPKKKLVLKVVEIPLSQESSEI